MKKIIYVVLVAMVLSLTIIFPVMAKDGIGDVISIDGMDSTIVGFQGGNPVYQSIIAPNNYTFYDGFGYNADNNYIVCRTAASAAVANTTSPHVVIENDYVAPSYTIRRGYLYFDTSLLSGFVITAATLNVYLDAKDDTDNESIQIQSGMPTYPHEPLVVGDYDLANYAGDGGSKDITTFNTYSYNAITLNAGGIAMINTSGDTKLCLRTTGDINNIAPTGKNSIAMYSSESSNYPYLSVTYTAIAPTIISVAASNVATTSARLNSSVTDNGGDPTCQIEFGYGTVSRTAVNYALYTTHTTVTVPSSDYTVGENPYLDVTGLAIGTPYFYRVKITNEFGSVVSVAEQTFTTGAVVGDMTQFLGYPNVNNISLNWVKAVGATNTIVRFRTDTYPTTTADGTLVYNGTANYYLHSGLTAGTTYYYSAWGESGGVYSANAINLTMTTSSEIGASTIGTGVTPSNWWQEPNESFLVHLEPVYSVINGVADSWGVPRGNAWLALSLLFAMGVGIGLYLAFKSASFALIVMAFVIAGFVLLHILPTFMLFIAGFLLLGAWSTRPTVV